MRTPLLLALLVSARPGAAQAPPEPVTPHEGVVTLPAGQVAELLERLEPGLLPARIPDGAWPDWSDRSGSGWGGELPWRSWVELVRAEASAERPDPARRFRLAVLARLQGRDGDAWRHLLACGADPALVAALLPIFVPGVPPASLGSSAPLPDGVLLAPALPPATEEPRPSLRSLAGRALEHRAVRIGEARLSLRVICDSDGIEVALVHLEGGPVRVRVRPPLPEGVERGQLFVDWERRNESAFPVELALGPKESEHTLWLTFHRREERWPAPLPEALPGLAPARVVIIRSPRGDEAHLARFAEALSELFGLRSELAPSGRPPGELLLEPIELDLDPEKAGSERKLAGMIGLSESLALARARR